MRAHLAAIGCNGQEISRAHLAAIGCNGLSISMLPIRADSASKCGGQPNGSGMDATHR